MTVKIKLCIYIYVKNNVIINANTNRIRQWTI